MKSTDKEVILMLADCNMNAAEAARRMMYHRNTIIFRMQSIKKKTGLNPGNFYDLVKLVEIVGGEEGG